VASRGDVVGEKSCKLVRGPSRSMVLGCQINSYYPGLAWTCLHLLLPAFLLAHQGPVTFFTHSWRFRFLMIVIGEGMESMCKNDFRD
jgi:hypothetical protein